MQDALPASDDWLDKLTAPLRASPMLPASFCRQQPRPNATALTKRYLDAWVAASPTSRSVTLTSPDELDRLDPLARLRLCAFDNVCSCIRRSVWQQIPFADTPIAEDIEWGRAVLLAGYRLDYVADAVVLHSHDRSARYEFARTYVLHRRLLRLVRRANDSCDGAPGERRSSARCRLHLECERQAAKAGSGKAGLGRALALAIAWPLGQYLGGLSAARGWKPIRFRGV